MATTLQQQQEMSKTTTMPQIWDEKQPKTNLRTLTNQDAPISGLQRFQEALNRFWIIEFVCIIAAVASFCGIVGLLVYLDGIPLNSWGPRISPNTVLAILTTVCKTTMMAVVTTCIAQLRWPYYTSESRPIGDLDAFDNATRGPMGAFKFLLLIAPRGGRIAYLTSLGAVLSIFALAVDPFAQQMIKYQLDTVPVTGDSSAATMPVSTGVGRGTTYLGRSSAWKAMYAGVLDFKYPLPFACATSNCTYPDFSSLGICASCEDAAPLLDWQCSSNSSDANNGCSIITSSVEGTDISISLNNGTLSADGDAKEYTLVKGSASQGYPRGFSDPTIFQVVLAQLLANLTAPVPQQSQYQWNTTLCSVRWCARTFKDVTVTQGVLSQPNVLSVDLYPNTMSSCYNSTTCQDFVTNDAANLAGGKDVEYRISINEDAGYLGQLLQFENLIGINANNTWDISKAFSITSTMFWNVNFTDVLTKGTDTFTDFQRFTQRSQNITGTALLNITHIRIRWGWLGLPAALVVPAGILLLAVVFTTYRTVAAYRFIWKSSSLPLVFHPADDPGKQTYRRPETMATMSERAGKVKAQLVENEEGKVAFVVDLQSATENGHHRT